MSGGGGQSGTTQVTQNRDPWAPTQPLLEHAFGVARQEFDQPQEFFPNSTVVPFSGQTEQGLTGAETLAAGGSPEITAARQQNFDTSSGAFLGAGNPYFSAMMDRVQNQVQPRVNSMFARAGRSGSAGHAEAMSRALADAGSALAFQNYGQERGLQQQAAQQAPGLYQSAFAPSEMLRQVGGLREGQAGAELQEQIARHTFDQNERSDAINRFLTQIGGGQYGGSLTSQQPIYSQSPFATGLGVASGLAGLGNTLFNPQFGLFS